MFDMFWYVWKNLGGTGTSMAIHQWFKAWSTLAILHQNQRIKCQILTNHSPVDLPRPCGKHLKQTRENPSFFTQRNLGLFGKKKGFISQWSIKGRVANHDGCFSIRLRPRNPNSKHIYVFEIQFQKPPEQIKDPRTDWRWKTIRQSFEISLIWKMWICWSATKKWTRSQIPQENEIPQENGGSKHLVYQDSIMPLKFVVQSGKIIHHHESSWIITHHKS
jgi:hypothetical protein